MQQYSNNVVGRQLGFADLEKALFRDSVRRLEDLEVGGRLLGCVRNVTNFGAFVDIGVGKDALMHVSAMRRGRELVVSVGAEAETIGGSHVRG